MGIELFILFPIIILMSVGSLVIFFLLFLILAICVFFLFILFFLHLWSSKFPSVIIFLSTQRTSFSNYFRTDLLIINFVNISSSENILILPFFPEGYFHWIQNSELTALLKCSQPFKDAVPLSSRLPCFLLRNMLSLFPNFLWLLSRYFSLYLIWLWCIWVCFTLSLSSLGFTKPCESANS